MKGWRDSLAARVVVVGLSSAGLTGCGHSQSSDYHRVEKVSSVEKTNPAAENSETKSDDPTTVAATVASVPGENPDVIQPNEEVPTSALAPVNVVDGADVAQVLKVAVADTIKGNEVRPASASVSSQEATPGEPRKPEVLIPNKTFRRDGASKALRVSYDDLDLLKVLNLEPVTENAVELMPTWLRDLDGQRIRIRGFMYPTFQADGIERFALARDNQICCFGRDPKLYDLVQVDMQSGKTTEYIPATRSFDVVGKFKIKMQAEGGKPYGLYSIEEAQIIDR